jgi:UDP-N-acetylglucosamine 2-epimerase (non-hydrolysing)
MTGRACTSKPRTEAKRIAVITTTRAEWHLLEPVTRQLVQDPRFAVSVLAGGAHLLPAHGHTIRVVEASAGCPVRRVDFAAGIAATDDGLAMARLSGRAVEAFADALSAEPLDCVVLLGDRFEIMAAALAATSLGIAVAHIEGGHVTEGAIDERFRHAITKLADLHFVALPIHAQRILALGEDPARIVITGPIGATLARSVTPLSREDMRDLSGFDPGIQPIFLATFHAETVGIAADKIAAVACDMIERLTAQDVSSPRFLITASNLDPGGDTINAALQALAKRHPAHVRFVPSIGRHYLAALHQVAGVVGNSSSGILEVCALGIPTLNIGTRQNGRDRYGDVQDFDWDAATLAAAVSDVVQTWRQSAARGQSKQPTLSQAATSSPWGVIANRLAEIEPERLRIKTFPKVAPPSPDGLLLKF